MSIYHFSVMKTEAIGNGQELVVRHSYFTFFSYLEWITSKRDYLLYIIPFYSHLSSAHTARLIPQIWTSSTAGVSTYVETNADHAFISFLQ